MKLKVVLDPGAIVPTRAHDLEVVDHLEETERGDNGFGSTGKF